MVLPTTEARERLARTEVEIHKRKPNLRKLLPQSTRSHPSFLRSVMSKMTTLGLFNRSRGVMKSQSKRLLPKMR